MPFNRRRCRPRTSAALRTAISCRRKRASGYSPWNDLTANLLVVNNSSNKESTWTAYWVARVRWLVESELYTWNSRTRRECEHNLRLVGVAIEPCLTITAVVWFRQWSAGNVTTNREIRRTRNELIVSLSFNELTIRRRDKTWPQALHCMARRCIILYMASFNESY